MSKSKADTESHHALLKRATDVFSDAQAARNWLKTPQLGLGGAIPLDLARTAAGCREVEKLLTRIDRGTYA